jgi:Transmembrane family 220, helix
MRIVNLILAIMFLLFAFVQVNDPDPVIWILVYGLMAVFSVMAMFEFYPQKFLIATAAVYTLYSLTLITGVIEWYQSGNWAGLFDDVAKMDHLYIEESREFLGLMICIIVLIVYIIRARMIRSATKNTPN